MKHANNAHFVDVYFFFFFDLQRHARSTIANKKMKKIAEMKSLQYNNIQKKNTETGK